ncbi:NETI motif-containing protein [Domibacillus indicus]|uniref:NETI motif-containing protein n=1 Tax=Domibacillus indicus TaxID=1437523 RepID=UPI0006180590|nr:NETI motif-containing protein [Domibacillus indicus]
MSKKRNFRVEENETIDDCLARMKREGYMPARRIEKPLFEERKENGETIYVPIGREIVFEGKIMT